jgi:hypothetical protein
VILKPEPNVMPLRGGHSLECVLLAFLFDLAAP